jgi:hypothetical protein
VALPYPISASQVDANSVVDETLMDAIRLNLEDHEGRIAAAFAFGSSAIVDDFLNAGGTPGIWGDQWTVGFAGANNDPVSASQHQAQMPTNTAGAGNYSVITGSPSRIHIQIGQDYTAVLQFRARRAGTNNDSYFMGWQDAALAASVVGSVTDVSDMMGFYRDTATGNWTFQCANGGVATTSTNIGTGASWGVFRITVTCSATAGNRQIAVEHGTTEAGLAAISGSPFTTNLTAQTLRPCFGQAYGTVGGDLRVDYVLAYPTGRPLAA